MARKRRVEMVPGEVLDLAKSLSGDLASGESLTGTPTVTVWLLANGTWTESVVTITGEAINTAELTDYNGDAIAIGDGVEFRLTAPTTRGTYEIRIQCASDGGTNPATTMDLTVDGPGVPA